MNIPTLSIWQAFNHRSMLENPTDVPKTLDFGRNESEIFMTSYQGGSILISRIETANGGASWTFQFTPASAEYCVANYREISTDHVHFTLVGNAGGVKKLARLIID